MRQSSRFPANGRALLAAVVLSIGTATLARAGHYSWTSSGPEAGTIRQILVASQDTSRLLAAAGYYGPYLFGSSDRGASWTYSEGIAVGFGHIVPDPVHAGVLYAPTYGSVLKTQDGGRSWQSSGAGLPATVVITAVAVAPSAPLTLYAVTQTNPAQVYRSLDGGQTWLLASSSLSTNFVSDLACDPSDAGTLYAAADSDVFKSVDGGASFAATGLNHSVHRFAMDGRPPATLYAATSDTGVFKSSDGGENWSAANGGIADHSIADLALDPSNPLRLFVASYGSNGGGGLYVTQNGGGSWSPVDVGIPVNAATAVAVDPANASRVYVGAGMGILRESLLVSADGGSTWAASDKGLSGFYSYAVEGHPSQELAAYCVSGSRVYRTDDSGADWTLKGTAPYALNALVLDPSSDDTLYAGYGSSGGQGVVKSVDGGATWNPATNGLAVSTLFGLSISPSAPDHLLASTQEGLFGTSDAGGLWSPLYAGDLRAAAFDPQDASILYAGLANVSPSGYGLLRSDDGGATWVPPSGIAAGYLHVNDLVASPAEPSRVYAAALSSIYRSVDRGASFSPANAGLPSMVGIAPYRLAADPAHAGTLYMLAGLGGGAAPEAVGAPQASMPGNVFRTTNGADSWTSLPGFLPVFGELDLSIGASGRVLYAATISGVFQFERSFLDVPDADPFWSSIDAAAMNGVTAGCGGGNFCPGASTSRAGVAVFLLRGKNGAAYAPPPATGTVFGDVPVGAPAAAFIEELANEGVTAGCGGGDYCPAAPLTRAAMAVLLLKTEHGSAFVPPPATGNVFGDVPADAFAAAWIEQLAAEGITAGCGAGNFCPDATVSRAQAAALVVRAFGLS